MATSTRQPESLVDDPGIWFAIATGLLVVTFLLTGLVDVGPTGTAIAAIVVAGVAGSRLTSLVAAALGLIGWAFYTGFTENTLGQLTFSGADLLRLGAFALATAGIAKLVKRVALDPAASHG
jgi:vacuolar-type H+-ATPase subunit I/STV1